MTFAFANSLYARACVREVLIRINSIFFSSCACAWHIYGNRCIARHLLTEMSVSECDMGDRLINLWEMLAFRAGRGVNLRRGKMMS